MARVLDAPLLEGAACLGKSDLMDPPDAGEDPDHQNGRLARAKRLCRTCPALNPCRSWLNTLPRNKKPTGVVAGQLIREDNR
ncbi:hypothetical protein A5633_03395 [Mycolicibacterium elephantis]|nr:hypothetical protein A5633_03395 [Mycolicibacterium elephantis]